MTTTPRADSATRARARRAACSRSSRMYESAIQVDHGRAQDDHPTRCGSPSPVDFQHVYHVEYLQERRVMSGSEKTDILRGTLDLLVLKTLDTLGPLHGYGIAQRIQQVSGSTLSLNQGTLYPALLRLEQRGWVQSCIGTSENNRHARFYSLTATGRRQLKQETEDWVRTSGIINRILRTNE